MGTSYVFIPVLNKPSNIKVVEDLEGNVASGRFTADECNALVKQLFPNFVFENGLGVDKETGIRCEVWPSDDWLSVEMRSSEADVMPPIIEASLIAATMNMILLDCQVTEIITAEYSAQYQSWYKKVAAQYESP